MTLTLRGSSSTLTADLLDLVARLLYSADRSQYVVSERRYFPERYVNHHHHHMIIIILFFKQKLRNATCDRNIE